MAELQEFVNTQIELISPLKVVSLELAAKAESVDVKDAATVKDAVGIRKEITKHQKAVKDLRLDITRQFDEVKTQFITAEKDVLKPADDAKELVGGKILAYEAEQERLRQVEYDRVNTIIDQFTTNVRAIRTLKAADERGAELKAIYAALPATDQNNGAIKLAFAQVVNTILERKDEIRTAQVDEAEQARAVAERRGDVAIAQLEAIDTEKEIARQQKQAPKTGIKLVTRFTVTNPASVPRALCVPSDQLIREAIKNGLTQIPGIEITQEKSF